MASTGDDPADASTLAVSALNVGMIDEMAFTHNQVQDKNVKVLAGHVMTWLDPPQKHAVVGLNEIHPKILQKLVEEVESDIGHVIGHAHNDSNSLLWRTP